ncbi:MAG: universal stress protein [Chloroflexi bacterium]|nr:universal stress protein [Chloroflexota bacterium]
MYQHILVPLDGSELAECVLPHVKSIALGCAVVKITLIRGVTPLHLRGGLESHIAPEERERIEKQAMDNAREYLEKIAAQLKDGGVAAVTEVIFGNIIDSIIDYVDKTGVDLIIIATHGRSGASRWVWGSVADRILRSACVPVMMVRPAGCAPGI